MTSIPTAERIALFLDQAEVLRSSTAVSTIADTKLTMKGTSSGDLAVEVEAPGDEATITYFTRIREFDTKGKDIYVADLLPELERSASPRRLALVEFLRRAHRDLGREIYDRPSQILGPGATPRQVWELWTYAHLIHLDTDKRATWAALDLHQKAFARFIAYGYAHDLYNLVTVVEAMLRDPAMDDRAVKTQILTVHPRYKGSSIPPFEAAKVRLPTT